MSSFITREEVTPGENRAWLHGNFGVNHVLTKKIKVGDLADAVETVGRSKVVPSGTAVTAATSEGFVKLFDGSSGHGGFILDSFTIDDTLTAEDFVTIPVLVMGIIRASELPGEAPATGWGAVFRDSIGLFVPEDLGASTKSI